MDNDDKLNVNEYLEALGRRGIVPGMDSIRRLLEELGNPQKGLPLVHIAGTNGKGSVFAFLDSILRTAGYRVGRYLSPTIRGYRERFQINGVFISEEELADLYCLIKKADDRIQGKGFPGPTLFEVETALAFLFFAAHKVDYALVETGMGGREDATNIMDHPLLTVITSISMDHTAWLGDSLEEIAAHKAGIIKAGCPCLVAPNPPEVMDVIRKRAEELGSDLIEAGRPQILEETYEGSRFIWEGACFDCPLPGSHQTENALLALEAGRILLAGETPAKDKDSLSDKPWNRDKDCLPGKPWDKGSLAGNRPDEDKHSGIKAWKPDAGLMAILQKGIRETRWPGRLELLSKDPLFYRDGAHNKDGILRLKAFIEKHFTNRRIIYIIGVLKDKDYDEMVRLLVPSASMFFVFRPRNARGLSEEILAETIKKRGGAPIVCPGVNEAVRMAREHCKKDDVLVLCGSLSFMEEMDENEWKK